MYPGFYGYESKGLVIGFMNVLKTVADTAHLTKVGSAEVLALAQAGEIELWVKVPKDVVVWRFPSATLHEFGVYSKEIRSSPFVHPRTSNSANGILSPVSYLKPLSSDIRSGALSVSVFESGWFLEESEETPNTVLRNDNVLISSLVSSLSPYWYSTCKSTFSGNISSSTEEVFSPVDLSSAELYLSSNSVSYLMKMYKKELFSMMSGLLSYLDVPKIDRFPTILFHIFLVAHRVWSRLSPGEQPETIKIESQVELLGPHEEKDKIIEYIVALIRQRYEAKDENENIAKHRPYAKDSGYRDVPFEQVSVCCLFDAWKAGQTITTGEKFNGRWVEVWLNKNAHYPPEVAKALGPYVAGTNRSSKKAGKYISIFPADL